jgi:hypothetical protein
LSKIPVADPSSSYPINAEKQSKQQTKSSRKSEELPVAHKEILLEILSHGKAVNEPTLSAPSLRVFRRARFAFCSAIRIDRVSFSRFAYRLAIHAPSIRSPARAAKKENKSECLSGAEESQFSRQDAKPAETFA